MLPARIVPIATADESVVVVALNFATTAASGFAITLAGKPPATACELWQIRGAKGATLDGITVNGAPADLSLPAAHCSPGSQLVLPPTSVSFIRVS